MHQRCYCKQNNLEVHVSVKYSINNEMHLFTLTQYSMNNEMHLFTLTRLMNFLTPKGKKVKDAIRALCHGRTSKIAMCGY
jgi:hypothetical protein